MHDEKTLIFQNICRLRPWGWRLWSKRALTLTLADMPFLKVVDGSDQRRDVLTPMHDEKTLISQNIRRLRPWRWRLWSKRALALTLADMPFLKVFGGSDNGRDVLTDA